MNEAGGFSGAYKKAYIQLNYKWHLASSHNCMVETSLAGSSVLKGTRLYVREWNYKFFMDTELLQAEVENQVICGCEPKIFTGIYLVAMFSESLICVGSC